MSDNPYQSPQTSDVAAGVLSGKQEDVRAVALYQRGIIFCILGYFAAVLAYFAVPPEVAILAAIGALVVVLAGAVFVFLLAIRVYGMGLGVLLGLLTLIPLFGLIGLVRVNSKATQVLRQNGIKVGFLGARM